MAALQRLVLVSRENKQTNKQKTDLELLLNNEKKKDLDSKVIKNYMLQ